jgi:hypothetical protein
VLLDTAGESHHAPPRFDPVLLDTVGESHHAPPGFGCGHERIGIRPHKSGEWGNHFKVVCLVHFVKDVLADGVRVSLKTCDGMVDSAHVASRECTFRVVDVRAGLDAVGSADAASINTSRWDRANWLLRLVAFREQLNESGCDNARGRARGAVIRRSE